ncbi:MAG: hypothetical protein KatS3mg113_0565 [Planctomycetaceae bacterium]|nr:MAG: hypothetical protein KatS3mg113_0565 [Planctomycetaceae bacterium]
MSRSVVIICEEQQFRRLRGDSQTPELWVESQHPLEFLEHCRQNIPRCLWLNPRWLQIPLSQLRDQHQREERETVLYALGDRLIFHIVVLHQPTPSSESSSAAGNPQEDGQLPQVQSQWDWYRQFRSELDQVMGGRASHVFHHLLLISEQNYVSDDLLSKLLHEVGREPSALYREAFVVDYMLEPSSEHEVVHAHRVWPLTVSDLILTLLHKQDVLIDQHAGVYAWRTFRLQVTIPPALVEECYGKLRHFLRTKFWNHSSPSNLADTIANSCRVDLSATRLSQQRLQKYWQEQVSPRVSPPTDWLAMRDHIRQLIAQYPGVLQFIQEQGQLVLDPRISTNEMVLQDDIRHDALRHIAQLILLEPEMLAQRHPVPWKRWLMMSALSTAAGALLAWSTHHLVGWASWGLWLLGGALAGFLVGTFLAGAGGLVRWKLWRNLVELFQRTRVEIHQATARFKIQATYERFVRRWRSASRQLAAHWASLYQRLDNLLQHWQPQEFLLTKHPVTSPRRQQSTDSLERPHASPFSGQHHHNDSTGMSLNQLQQKAYREYTQLVCPLNEQDSFPDNQAWMKLEQELQKRLDEYLRGPWAELWQSQMPHGVEEKHARQVEASLQKLLEECDTIIIRPYSIQFCRAGSKI